MSIDNLDPSEAVWVALLAADFGAQRFEEISRRSDPDDRSVQRLLRGLAADQRRQADTIRRFGSRPSPPSAPPPDLADHVLALLPSLHRPLGDGRLSRDQALYLAEALEEELAALHRELAGHAASPGAEYLYLEVSARETSAVGYLRGVLP